MPPVSHVHPDKLAGVSQALLAVLRLLEPDPLHQRLHCHCFTEGRMESRESLALASSAIRINV